MDLHEGRLRAWLDGELPAEEAEELSARIETAPELRSAVDDLRARDARTRQLLGHLVDPPPPTDRVRAALREARSGSRRRRLPGSRLAQAAALVLLLAGGASAAIPGSPVREWLRTILPQEPTAVTGTTTEPAEPGAAGPDETGLMMAGHDGAIRIELVDLPSDAEIVVRLTDEETAGVFGPAGSGLEWEGEAGRIRARARSGPIRVELPRTLASADLLVDGRVYLLKRGDRMDLRVPPADSSATEIRLRAGS